jgi:hypothetical protein
MSDIPRARHFLKGAEAAQTLADCKSYVRAALGYMTREPPKFRTPARRPKMTREQVARAKQLRRAEMSVDDIGKRIGQNIGRVSEAINGKRKGI